MGSMEPGKFTISTSSPPSRSRFSGPGLIFAGKQRLVGPGSAASRDVFLMLHCISTTSPSTAPHFAFIYTHSSSRMPLVFGHKVCDLRFF